MRQVPEDKIVHPSYAVVGAGRLARHLEHYFTLLDIPFKIWTRSPNQANTEEKLKAVVSSVSHVLLAISDSSIEPFIIERPWLKEKTLIHFSGAVTTTLAESAHPLMAFADQLFDLETYKRIPFVLEKNRSDFKRLFPDLPNPSFAIDSEYKPLYHSLCVMGGNFTHFLWLEVFNQTQDKLGLSREVFFPYMEQIFANLKSDPQGLATGPLVRKDIQTIQTHLEALKSLPLEKVYRSFLDLKGINP